VAPSYRGTFCRNSKGRIEANADFDADGYAASNIPTVVVLAILALFDGRHNAAIMQMPSLNTRGLALRLPVLWVCCDV
jgi:hypothetical protein